MQVVGEIADVPSGWTVDKIGIATGWTYGQVTNTCADFVDGGYRWLCHHRATYGDAGGDSGAPVFVWNASSGTATLVGIHVGTSGSTAVFSSMGRIQQELGPLTTYYSVATTGPTAISTPGTYSWQATPNPQPGSHSYQWSVYYFSTGQTQNLGTSSSQQLFVTDFGHFEMRVTATAANGAVASDTHFVNNNISGGPEESKQGR